MLQEMARRKVITSGLRPWRCPICEYAGLHGKKNFPTDGALAQHIVMMEGALNIGKEGPHKDWRGEKGISPVEYQTMEDVQKMKKQILRIINVSPLLFRKGEG